MSKKQQWIVLTALVCVGVLAAGWFLLVSPQRSKAQALRNDTAGVQDDNRALQNTISALKAQEKDLPAKEAEVARIAQQLPDNPALPSLIRTLDDAATKNSVELVSVAPSEPTAVGSAAPTLSAIPVAINVSGGYFQLDNFIADLERLGHDGQRAFLLTGVSLSVKDGASDTASSTVPVVGVGPLNAQLQTRVYMNVPAATPTHAPAPKASPSSSDE